MLLALFYLYSKSPKKLRELSDIVSDIGEVFEFPKGGDTPICSQGSRWISHKHLALQRIIDRYRAYISHLTSISADTSVKGADKARLKGYLTKWQQGKMLIGSAMYIDALNAPSLLSKSLQGDNINIVQCLRNILHAKKSLKNLVNVDPLDWPTVKLVCNRLSDDKEYQGTTLQRYSDSALRYCKDQALADVSRLESKMRERLEWSDVKLLRAILIFLDTQTWRCVVANATDSSCSDKSLTEVLMAVELIATMFREPLEAAGINLLVLQDQIAEVVEYARSYLSIESEEYHKVWYKLYVCPDASRWRDILVLCELCFSLPFSNVRVERIFSSLKLVKTERRTRLHHTLSDLLEIHVEGPPLSDFSPKQAVEASLYEQ